VALPSWDDCTSSLLQTYDQILVGTH
jgi:hypothetical protein